MSKCSLETKIIKTESQKDFPISFSHPFCHKKCSFCRIKQRSELFGEFAYEAIFSRKFVGNLYWDVNLFDFLGWLLMFSTLREIVFFLLVTNRCWGLGKFVLVKLPKDVCQWSLKVDFSMWFVNILKVNFLRHRLRKDDRV